MGAKAKSISYHKDVLLRPDNTLQEVVSTFSRTRLDAVPVVDEQKKVIGVMTKHNLYKALLKGYPLDSPIAGFYARPAVCVDEDMNFGDVYSFMQKKELGQVVVTDRNNHPWGMVTKMSVIENLRTRSERQARELASLLDALENGVLAVNSRSIITVINPAAEAMLGVKAKDVLGRIVADVLPHVRLDKVMYNGSVKNWHKIDGLPGILAKYLPVYNRGLPGGAIAVLHDLTDYERLAQEFESVKEIQETLATVLDLAYDGLLTVNAQGLVTTANRSMMDFLGLKPNQIMNRSVEEIIPELGLHETVASGLSDQGDVRTVRGNRCIVTRLPIMRENQILGAVAKITFKGLNRLPDLVKRLEALESQISYYRDELSRVTHTGITFDDIVGNSPSMVDTKELAARTSRSLSSVLLLGESGTGKELFAAAIHNHSGRRGPFVRVNCAAMPDNLLESEFFGYEGGAFTGAKSSGKPGKFELAHQGTLFLDEIGDMSLPLQAKLLRVLQEKEFERVGGIKTVRVDVRIIAATNRDIERLIADGKFREDLFYRLNVIAVRIPPLRERKGDIYPLVMHFIRKHNRILGAGVTGISPQAMEILMAHRWPGNVRELENVVERALNIISSGEILPAHLPEYLRVRSGMKKPSPEAEGPELNMYSGIAGAEKELILRALAEAGGNRTRAAEILGISRTKLYDRITRYGIGNKQ
ncbi:MAG: sigma 54-interacting transcriptional regulator [Peptococcaceae bacterium]|nr:sigma 54-interacting transcriptional regulator [Peptococcaceae bacterium]